MDKNLSGLTIKKLPEVRNIITDHFNLAKYLKVYIKLTLHVCYYCAYILQYKKYKVKTAGKLAKKQMQTR